MTGFLLFAFIVAEIITVGSCFMKKTEKKVYVKKRFILNLAELGCFCLLLLSGIVNLGMRFTILFAVLAVRVLYAGIRFAAASRRPGTQKNIGLRSSVGRVLGNGLLLAAALMPAFVFSNYEGLPVTGKYEVETISDIFVDESRLESFEDDGSCREVPVEFWFPKNAGDEKFPIVLFSHGAFGYRQSNYSTYAELASHGYVVCSMDHPYHSFYTKDTSGKTILVSFEFMKAAMGSDNASEEEIFRESREWLKIRVEDINFVLDTVLKKSGEGETGVYALVDEEKIGVMGHSLGGAASVALGRERSDIGAVIDIDGTMLGEQTDCDDGVYTYIMEPYPVPLLAIDNESHHKEMNEYGKGGERYVNYEVLKNAVDGTETWFAGAAHMDFTDLPLFSKILADMLGSGDIDHETCIRTMNQIILDYFNHYLKNQPELVIRDHYL